MSRCNDRVLLYGGSGGSAAGGGGGGGGSCRRSRRHNRSRGRSRRRSRRGGRSGSRTVAVVLVVTVVVVNNCKPHRGTTSGLWERAWDLVASMRHAGPTLRCDVEVEGCWVRRACLWGLILSGNIVVSYCTMSG